MTKLIKPIDCAGMRGAYKAAIDQHKQSLRHLKRGTTYEVVGQAWLQHNAGFVLMDMEPMIIYQGEDGTLWVRPEREFTPDRFELLDNIKNGDRS